MNTPTPPTPSFIGPHGEVFVPTNPAPAPGEVPLDGSQVPTIEPGSTVSVTIQPPGNQPAVVTPPIEVKPPHESGIGELVNAARAILNEIERRL